MLTIWVQSNLSNSVTDFVSEMVSNYGADDYLGVVILAMFTFGSV